MASTQIGNTNGGTEYTEKQWEEERRLNKFCGQHPNWFHSGCTLQCPQCGAAGFYGPKIDSDSNKYRACKFCGWWQEVRGAGRNIGGGQPYRCRAVFSKSYPNCIGNSRKRFINRIIDYFS